jgi:hypothetical protein
LPGEIITIFFTILSAKIFNECVKKRYPGSKWVFVTAFYRFLPLFAGREMSVECSLAVNSTATPTLFNQGYS